MVEYCIRWEEQKGRKWGRQDQSKATIRDAHFKKCWRARGGLRSTYTAAFYQKGEETREFGEWWSLVGTAFICGLVRPKGGKKARLGDNVLKRQKKGTRFSKEGGGNAQGRWWLKGNCRINLSMPNLAPKTRWGAPQ